MKYSSNHPWKFKSWFNAYLVGLSQLVVVVGIEFVNIIMRLWDLTFIEVAMNFVDLILISDFGEYYFTIVSGDRLSKLIIAGSITLDTGAPLTLKALLEIETTTSVAARGVNDKNRLKQSPFGLNGGASGAAVAIEQTEAKKDNDDDDYARVSADLLTKERPEHIYFKFSDRSFLNKVCRLFYLL